MKEPMSWRLGQTVRDRLTASRRGGGRATARARRVSSSPRGWSAATTPPDPQARNGHAGAPSTPSSRDREEGDDGNGRGPTSPDAGTALDRGDPTAPGRDDELVHPARIPGDPTPTAADVTASSRPSAAEVEASRSDVMDDRDERRPPTSGDGPRGEPTTGAPTPAGAASTDASRLHDPESTPDSGRESNMHSNTATVVCVANQKGGVGKTTTTVSLAAALSALGARVLVVDLDPQGNATTGLGLRAEEGDPSTYGVLVDGMPVTDAARGTDVERLDVLPSSLDLAGAEVELVPAFSREMRLQRALEDVRDDYDVVFVDCPPSLGLLTINALVAADQVLVPIQCEYYALEGLGQLMRTVKLVGDNLNRGLELGGVVLTMYDGRTNLSQQVVDEVREYFGERAYGTIIPRTVRLSEAPSFGQPITVFDPSSRGARAYDRLAREMAERLGLDLGAPDVSPLDRLLGGSAPPSASTETNDPTDPERPASPSGSVPDAQEGQP